MSVKFEYRKTVMNTTVEESRLRFVGAFAGNHVRSDVRVGVRFQQNQEVQTAKNRLSASEVCPNRRAFGITPS